MVGDREIAGRHAYQVESGMRAITFAQFLLLSLLAAQSPDTSRFKIQSSSVVVDVIVTDRKGNVVSGLTSADFHVFENAVPQKIASFEAPLSGAPAHPGDASEVTVQSAGSFSTR